MKSVLREVRLPCAAMLHRFPPGPECAQWQAASSLIWQWLCGYVGTSAFLRSLCHTPRTAAASEGSTANILLKAGSETLWLEAQKIKPSYLFENLLNRLFPTRKEGSPVWLLCLVHPWHLRSCDMIPICLHGGLSAELIVCTPLCSPLMFISLQYLQKDWRNKSLCKWQCECTILRNIKIH